MNEERLLRCIRDGRAMYAMLIAGPEGSGRAALARKCAAVYCCGEADPARLQNCPDYIELGDAPIGVNEVRALIESTAAQSFSHGRRAYLLKNAHRMTPQAQNALLKTLEEPPENTMLLLTGAEMGLLPTIRSRCAIWRLGAEPVERVQTALEQRGIAKENAYFAACWSGGVCGLAEERATEGYRTFRETAAKLLENALFARLPFQETAKRIAEPVFAEADGQKKRKPDAENAGLLLECWADVLRDALICTEGGAAPCSPESENLSRRIAENFTTGRILGMIESVLEAQKSLAYYRTSPAMTLDAVLVRLMNKEKDT